MEHKKRMKLLNASLAIDILGIIGVFVGGFLNSPKIIGCCMLLLILSITLLIASTE